jgi:hypothetical protein
VSDRTRLIEHMIQELERPVKELSEWEENFMASVKIQFQLKSDLSDKQVTVLQRIYDEKGS